MSISDLYNEDFCETGFFDVIESLLDYRGKTPLKLGMSWSDVETPYLALSALNVKDNGIDTTKEAHYGTADLYKKWMKDKPLREQQILMTTEAPAGVVMQIPDKRPYILSQRVIALNVDPTKVDECFFAYLLRSHYVQNQIERLCSGGTAKGISQKHLKEIKVRYPKSIKTQQKIAEFFTALDEKIHILSTQLDYLKSQKDGVMNDIFNQSIRFNSSNGHDYDEWQDVVLKDIAEVKTGPFGSLLHAEDYVECGTPIVTTEHFKNGQLPISAIGIPQVAQHDVERLKNYRLTYGDIVFSRVGSVDINALVEQENDGWLFSGRVLRVRVKDSIDSRFLHYALLDKSVKKDIISRAVGLTMASINTSILEETHICVPKSIAEQNKISSFIHTLDNKIMLKEQCINTMHLLKKAFMQRMFV